MDNLLKSALLTPFNLLYRINPRLELGLLFRLKQGYRLNLEHPRTYNEKLQWIKLYDRNPLMTKCSDKYAVRAYVTEKGCGGMLNRLIWHGFDPEQIPFDDLPDRFVIKVTQGSTFNIICTDKSCLDREKTVRQCRKWLKTQFLPAYGEWFYGVEKPRIIIEEYLDDGTPRLMDYKVYCFGGVPCYIGVDTGDENGGHYKDIYDPDWNLLEGYEMAYPRSGRAVPKPECLAEMLDAASRLSEDFLHARVDFYIVGGRVVFGEITFTNSAGFGRVAPEKFALEMGSRLRLPFERDSD